MDVTLPPRVRPAQDVSDIASLATLVCAKSLTGAGVELGVFGDGYMAEKMLRDTSLTEWTAVSPFREWDDHSYPEAGGDIALETLRRKTTKTVQGCGASMVVSRASYAHTLYEEGDLDFLFVNMHHGVGCLKDWWPKVRVGGLLVGEGYSAELHQQVSDTGQDVFMAFPLAGPPLWMVYV